MDAISREAMEFEPGEQDTFLEARGNHHHHHRMTSAGNNSASSAPHYAARRRSLSVASAKPSVETVVVKAKRAASSLWLLLHAQKCTLAGRCPTPGCKEAKLLHLHMKTCPEKEGLPCPTGFNGCQQSRKLLAHYRRCRSIRVKQAGQPTSKGNEQHHCLVCSLVARQARSMLDRSTSKSSRKPSSSKHSVVSSLVLSSSSVSPPSSSSSSNKNKNHLHNDLSSSSSSSPQMMPPPLHARRLLSSSAKVADAGQHHQHQDFPNIQSITIAVDSSLHDDGNVDEERQVDHRHHRELLGSSLDSARDSILRTRSASVAAESCSSSQQEETVASARHRSASVGGVMFAQQQQQQCTVTTTSSSLSKGCETIHEEGCCSDTSSVDKTDFELDLA